MSLVRYATKFRACASQAVVSSVPSHYALKLKEAGGDWVIPFVTPYYHAGNRLNWYFDKTLVGKIRKLIETGKYAGIGEIHLAIEQRF